jgi:hypothetical protein
MRDLFPRPPGLTLQEYARAKRLPEAHLREQGITQITYQGAPALKMPYKAPDGTEKAARFRLAIAGENRFVWRSGSKVYLYGAWRLAEARAAGWVLMVEGESDTQTAWYRNVPCVGIPGAGAWREEWTGLLTEVPAVYIVMEPDAGGQQILAWLAKSSLRDKAFIVKLDGAKDISELHCQAPERFNERLKIALDNAVPWTNIQAADAEAEAEAAWVQCERLATEPNILSAFAAALRQHGIAGEQRFAKLAYLATTSRFLPRPVSVAAKGPSSAGKSVVLQRTLDFFPPQAYYPLTGMSQRALVYSQEPMQHRMLVLYEAAGLEGDFASYVVRSLLSEGRIRYETVVKTEHGPEAILIEREGPTGLLVTTTKIFLHPENETRLLSVPVDDSPAQTRNVLREIARDGAGGVDFTPWHALQTWLAGSEHRVSVPFAATLAECIPPVAIRLRRDFGTLLALVRAHALLHQATRTRDDHGRIVAELTDYEIVRGLVADLMAEGVEASVSPTIRETVEAIRAMDRKVWRAAYTVKQVANELGIDIPPALRRVRMAIAHGYLMNEETRKGRPARLVLADDLPNEVVLLPEADDPRLAEFTITGKPEQAEGPPSPGGDFDEAGDDSWPAEFMIAQDPVGNTSRNADREDSQDDDWRDGDGLNPDLDLWSPSPSPRSFGRSGASA